MNYTLINTIVDMMSAETPYGWIYVGDDRIRYLLGEPKEKNILVFGINPRTATPLHLDPTLKRVKQYAKTKMLNMVG